MKQSAAVRDWHKFSYVRSLLNAVYEIPVQIMLQSFGRNSHKSSIAIICTAIAVEIKFDGSGSNLISQPLSDSLSHKSAHY